jgi:hypothetical protein
MILAVLVVTAAQLLDLGTFVRMVMLNGPLAEANPLVRQVLSTFGVPYVAVLKIVALSLVVAIIAVLASRADRPRNTRLAGAVAATSIVAGIIGGWTNAISIVGSIH